VAERADAFEALPHRQRLAIAILTAAIELPAPMQNCAALWREAARALPDVDLRGLCVGDRLGALRRAREIVDALIAEGEAAAMAAGVRPEKARLNGG
jgi:hypothetical protein